ncbi:hypothetical protein M5689_006422 [Euphorbia peplus]|nr:hypothetical protein M5689_006422 [Euphorbia peplus]
MAASAYSGIIRPDSQLGISLNLCEESILTIGPVAGGDNASSSPFPLASDLDLVLNQETRAFPSGKTNVVFPRSYVGWDALVKKLTPEFEGLWRNLCPNNPKQAGTRSFDV